MNFKGTFNWYGEIHVLHTSADHVEHAKLKMCAALAKRLDTSQARTWSYFNCSGKDNWKVEEIKGEEE